MAQVTAYQVVSAGRLCAFQEHVVFWIGANQKAWLGRNHDGRTLNRLDDLLLNTFSKAEFRPRENFGILPKNWR